MHLNKILEQIKRHQSPSEAIDAGIAALMQNANKGFDPAALMAMMNNGNGMFGGNGGWWWIFIIVLF